jgi:transcriptional regulator with XRE-family HTH domain
MATIGQNIKALRIRQGLTQDDLAKKAELKYSTLAKIEGDFVKKPGVQMIAKVAKALSVTMEDLLK